ncbi:MAG: tocopherol cyclase family protein [Cyclobacteriaceae bacterium]
MFQRLQSLFNPERFQGHGKTKSYFEGWYFKLVSKDKRSIAVIPGLAFDANGNGHAFIQILDGNKKISSYIRFDISQFRASKDKFLVTIGGNVFSDQQITLNLDELKGTVSFRETVGWPKPWYSPGIMGPFSFMPFMECYHGIVSMDHVLQGALDLKGENIDFWDGRGYLEKDWGRSFPSAYTWMQSNHFKERGISLKCSVARIPWLGSSFTGFIGGLWLKDHLIRFTTYNNSDLLECRIDREQVKLKLKNPDFILDINAHRSEATQLASPIQGAMEGRIQETMDARLDVRLTLVRSGKTVFEDSGYHAGLEVAGDIATILK